jgi:ribosome recycling factor
MSGMITFPQLANRQTIYKNMAYNFTQFKTNISDVEDWLRRELSTIRTGRATPAILDGVKVEAYGSFMPLNQVGNISVQDARMILVTPWDTSLTKAVEKAITDANLGLSVSGQSEGIRVIFPELTSDRRTTLLKISKQKLEDARVTLRSEREKVVKDFDKQQKESLMSEDDIFRAKAELQKMIDSTNSALDQMLAKKEKEISE